MNELPGLRRSLINLSTVWLYRVGAVLFAFVSVPLITRRFGFDGLAIWLLVQQFASHVQLLELGLASSLGRVLSRDQALGNKSAYTANATSALAILAAMGMCVALIAFPLGRAFPHLFDLSPTLSDDAMAAMAIAVLMTGLTLPFRSAIGVLASQHRFSIQAGVDGVVLLVRLILIAIVCTIDLPHPFLLLALAVFLPNLLGAIVLFAIAARLAPHEIFRPNAVALGPIKELLDISLAAMVVTASAVLLRQGSPILTGLAVNTEAVPLIALPIMFVASVSPFLGIASQLISPIASQLDAAKDRERLKAIYFMAIRYSLAAGFLIILAMYVLLPMILPIWLGRHLVDAEHVHAIYVNSLIVFGAFCFTTPALLARSVLIAVGRHRTAARGEVMSAMIGLVIGWALLKYSNLGATGMAAGVAAAYVARAIGSIAHQLAHYFDISILKVYSAAIWRPVVSAFPFTFGIILSSFVEQLWLVLVILSFSFLAWIICFWFVVVESDHRAKLSRGIKSFFVLERKFWWR